MGQGGGLTMVLKYIMMNNKCCSLSIVLVLLFIRCCLPCRQWQHSPCFLCEKRRGRGVTLLTWGFAIFIVIPSPLSSIVCCWLPHCLLLVIKRQQGRGGCLTWINVNDDDHLCHHHLDMACPLMCYVIFDPHHHMVCTHGSVTCHCMLLLSLGCAHKY